MINVTEPIKVAFIGGMRSGKDTLAKLVVEDISDSCCIGHQFLSFSTGIHDVLKLTMPSVYAEGKPREHLQVLGQKLREAYPNIWVDYLFNSSLYFEAVINNDTIAITDVRQPNEVERLRAEGFCIIKVVADFEVRKQRAEELGDIFTEEMMQHETEQMALLCTDYDYLVENNGTLSELQGQALLISNRLRRI